MHALVADEIRQPGRDGVGQAAGGQGRSHLSLSPRVEGDRGRLAQPTRNGDRIRIDDRSSTPCECLEVRLDPVPVQFDRSFDAWPADGDAAALVGSANHYEGFKILTDDASMQFIGEIEMGEWVTVVDPDGSRRQVEVRSEMMPWHRRPLEGEVFDFNSMLTMLQSTSHLLDQEPDEEDRHHAEQG